MIETVATNNVIKKLITTLKFFIKKEKKGYFSQDNLGADILQRFLQELKGAVKESIFDGQIGMEDVRTVFDITLQKETVENNSVNDFLEFTQNYENFIRIIYFWVYSPVWKVAITVLFHGAEQDLSEIKTIDQYQQAILARVKSLALNG